MERVDEVERSEVLIVGVTKPGEMHLTLLDGKALPAK
jgi:hypothetical protein